MLVEFESFFYEFQNGSWYFKGSSDLLFNTEVKNIGVLERLKLKFKV